MTERQTALPTLVHLTRTDPAPWVRSCPRVRHRADALLLVAHGRSLAAGAREVRTSVSRLRAWRDRFLAAGRDGLRDRPRRGRPPRLDAVAHTGLTTARTTSPRDHGDPVTMWTVADLTDLLARQGYLVHRTTVTRALHDLHALGFRSCWPRYDLTHRQAVAAVASAKQVRVAPPKQGLLPELDSAVSPGMRVPPFPPQPGNNVATMGHLRGRPVRGPAAGQDQRMAMFGALDDGAGQIITRGAPHTSNAEFAAFLGDIARPWPTDQVMLVLDNASYHRSAARRTWWADQHARLAARLRVATHCD